MMCSCRCCSATCSSWPWSSAPRCCCASRALPSIPVLLAVFVVGSGVLHGTEAEFVPRFLVALAAVGVAELGGRAWASPDALPTAGTGAAILLAVQTLILIRYSLRRRRA